MENFVKRLVLEKSSLQFKLDKLKQFIDSDKFKEISPLQQSLSKLQLKHMTGYSNILFDRISDLGYNYHDVIGNKYFTFGFETALEHIKNSVPVTRNNWSGHKFVIKQIPADISGEIIPVMQSLPQSAKAILISNTNSIHYHDQLLVVDIDTGDATGYFPTGEDLFAEDWSVVNINI